MTGFFKSVTNGISQSCSTTIWFLFNGTADLLSQIGNTASHISGITFASSYYMDDGLHFDCYGNMDLQFGIDLELNIAEPALQHQYKASGELSKMYQGDSNLTLGDLFETESLRHFSLMTLAIGVTCKTLSTLMQTYSKSRCDKERLNPVDFIPPSWGEYGNHAVANVLSIVPLLV
jgi:hypothetical protein